MNYRKFYENELYIKVPNTFDVHHIDCNHENNNIDNLVMLPKKLHEHYHSLKQQIDAFNDFIIETKLLGTIEKGNASLRYKNEITSEFTLCYYECQKWIDYKHFLQGKIKNIHNIDILECD